ncbi:hypothetical protein M0R04_14970 [Candidatus Dojkabacteria bacterium]|nr:hypothetical protein [Candidatus Dojkabacteria bacterium]
MRTVVVFNNDELDLLVQDPDIGKKIYKSIIMFDQPPAHHPSELMGSLGYVAEQADTTVTKLLVIGKNGEYGVDTLATMIDGVGALDPELRLVKKAALNLGYDLVKKS